MNTTASPATKPGKNGSPPTTTKPPAPAQPGASKEAKRLAATILEVLAGVRTPPDAAQALSISVPRYYLLEQRALDSLVAGCEPRRQGRMATPERELAHLRKELERSRRDCARQQALARWRSGRSDWRRRRQTRQKPQPKMASAGRAGPWCGRSRPRPGYSWMTPGTMPTSRRPQTARTHRTEPRHR